MKTSLPVAALSLSAIFNIALADDIKPGLWKISMESQVAASPDWKPEPIELTQCLSAADAKNPAPLLMGMGSSGASGCDFPNKQFDGNHFTFDVSCAGTLGIKGHGEVSFTAESLDGFLNVNLGETEKIDMRNKIHANYIGACPVGGGM